MKQGLRKSLLNYLKFESAIGEGYMRSIDLERYAVSLGFSGSYAKRELKKMEKAELLDCYHSEGGKRYANFRIKRKPIITPIIDQSNNTVYLPTFDNKTFLGGGRKPWEGH